MRWFAWCLMIVSAVLIGCEKPEETIPPVTPTSGTTDSADTEEGDHEHDEGDHEHAEGEHDHGEGDHDHGEEDGEHHAEGDTDTAAPSVESPDVIETTEGEGVTPTEAPDGEDTSAVNSSEKTRFVADTSLEVPDMMCPYACWPSVKKTLATVPGVEDIQLAEQPDGTPEGEIRERIVELKVDDSFDVDAAIAALGKINYKSEVIN